MGQTLVPEFQYMSPDQSPITLKPDLKNLIEKVVSTANQMVGWGLRTFHSRSRHLMMVLMRYLVQPHLDYCSQMLSPAGQEQINKFKSVHKSLLDRIWGGGLAELLGEVDETSALQSGEEEGEVPDDLHLEALPGTCVWV